MNLNHTQAKPRCCVKCGVMKIATKFHTNHVTGQRYPHCIECGAGSGVEKTCTVCNETKQRAKHFGRSRSGTHYSYHDECKLCRPAAVLAEKLRTAEARRNEAKLTQAVKKEAKSAASKAKALARIAEKDKVGWVKPVEAPADPCWPWKYNGMVYEQPSSTI